MKLLHKPTVLVLDLDLTLHNVISHYDHSINETMLHFGQQALTKEELLAIGDNFVSTKAVLLKFFSEHLANEAFEYYINHFMNREIPVNSLLPGAQELLTLVRKDLKLPIIGVTNSEEHIAKKILRDLDVLQFFDYVIGISDEHKPKPDVQMLVKALRHIDVEASPSVWFVGDRHTDTKCAKDAGCSAIRFYHKNQPEDENADLFINCHYNLYAIMKAQCLKS